jgi:hypothetical protein
MNAIAALNDAFRLSPGSQAGRVLFTAGVSDLGVEFLHLALGLVRLLPVRSLGKGAVERCQHQRHHKGCAVYH